jgi:uncharacterized protein (TIGR03437 family)
MDAANLSIKRLALSFALLIPAAAFAQTPPVFVASPDPVTIVGGNGSLAVSSTGGPIATFNATITYPNASDTNWLCINPPNGFGTNPSVNASATGGPTPETFTLSVCGTPTINVTSHTAIVTLVATDNSGAAALGVPVSYQVGSGGTGGSGSISASSPSITQTISYGSQVTVYETLTTASTVPISFTLPSVPSWITVFQTSGNSGQVSAGQSATLEIILSGAGLNEATYTTTLAINNQTGTLSIPVTLNNGVAGGTTGSTGSLSVYPTNIPWSYSTANSGVFPASTTINLTSTNGDIGYTATATSSNGWLLVNSGYTTTGTVGITPLVIGPTTNLAALSPGTYTGTVAITGSDGSTATVTVTATVTGTGSGTVTISPSPISLSASLNGSTTSTVVTINSAVSGTLTGTVTGSGLSISIPNANVTAGVATTITVFGNPAGLPNGTVVGTLNVSVAGNSAGAQINFVVGTGSTGGGTTTAAAPSQLYFYYEPATSMQVSQDEQIYLSGSGNYTITSSTANSSPNWLSVLTTAGALPATVYVVVNASGLASGTYTGILTVTNTSTNTSSQVTVTLLVQGISTIYASPGDWIFNYIANTTSTSQVQAITVATSDSSQANITASVTNPTATPWLTVAGGGTASALALTVTTNASNLANGTYTGSITVTGGFNTLTIPIVLTVTGSSVSTGTGTLTLGASSLTLQALVNGTAVSQTLSVGASTTTTVTVSSQVTSGSTTWLSVSPAGTTTAPTTLTISANPAGLAAGNYSGTITLQANGSTQTVGVTFVVGTTSSSGTSVTVTANGGTSTSPSLTFTAAAVGASVPSQYISVLSAAGQSSAVFTVAASTTSGGNWLTLNTTAGTQYTTPISAITVSVNDAGLAAGTYSGQITVSPVGGTAVTVPVTLMVGGVTTITVPTTGLTFSYQAGSATPAAQTVAVTVTNAASGAFSATATSTPSGWLVVTPTSGTAPSNLSVSISPTNLTAGTYTGSITVAGTSGATGSTVIPVTLTVTVPLPTITTVVNAASFLNEPISPGEIITIGGTNIGPGTPLSFTLTSIGGIQTVPSTPLGGVQVTVNGYAAPLLYVSATQINAIVPYEVAGILRPTVLVTFLGQSSNGVTATGAATAPGIFTANGSGTGPGAILNANSSVNSASNPAARGTVVQVFMTGEGQTNPAGVDGKVTVAAASAPYTAAPLLPIVITVGGVAANYQFAGEAPGLVSGVMQLNVIIPPASSLTTTGAVPLVVSIGGVSSQSSITVNVN